MGGVEAAPRPQRQNSHSQNKKKESVRK